MKNLKNFLVLLLISFIFLGCAPESKHNSSDGDGSEETTTPEKPVSEEQKIEERIEKNISDFFNIPLKLGDSFVCISGKCQKSNKRECLFQIVERGYGKEMDTMNMNFPKPSEMPPPNECHFTLTNLSEATGFPGPGNQYGVRRLMIACSNIASFKNETDGPKIFSIYKEMVSLVDVYFWDSKTNTYDHMAIAGKLSVNKNNFSCLK
jgi:hypothetical protein